MTLRLVVFSGGCLVLALFATAGLALYTSTHQVSATPPVAALARSAYMVDRNQHVLVNVRPALRRQSPEAERCHVGAQAPL